MKSDEATTLLTTFIMCLIFGLVVNLVGYNKGLSDGEKWSDNRVKQLEAALKIHSIEIPKEIRSE
jgi:hypothetical protein